MPLAERFWLLLLGEYRTAYAGDALSGDSIRQTKQVVVSPLGAPPVRGKGAWSHPLADTYDYATKTQGGQ